MVRARDEHGQAFALAGVPEAVVHGKAARDLGEALAQAGQLRRIDVELDPHEEAPALGIGRVLIGLDDVRSALGEGAARSPPRCRADPRRRRADER